MPSLHHRVRGYCDDSAPVLLPIGDLGTPGLCVMLHLTWPSQAAVSPQKPVEPAPIKPKHTHAIESKPFAGLTQNPPCALCAQEAPPPQAPPPVPPEPMPPTHCRPRVVDTSRHFCP